MSELKLLNWKERASYVAGWTMILTVAPLVACVVFATVLWEAIDRGFAIHGNKHLLISVSNVRSQSDLAT